LFTRKLNSPEANYKASTSREEKAHIQTLIIIIIIIIMAKERKGEHCRGEKEEKIHNKKRVRKSSIKIAGKRNSLLDALRLKGLISFTQHGLSIYDGTMR
jgi:hypothetical protein